MRRSLPVVCTSVLIGLIARIPAIGQEMPVSKSDQATCQCALDPKRIPSEMLPDDRLVLTLRPSACSFRDEIPSVEILGTLDIPMPEIESSARDSVRRNRGLRNQCSGKFRVHGDEEHKDLEAHGTKANVRFEVTCHWGGGASNVRLNPHVHVDLEVALEKGSPVIDVVDVNIKSASVGKVSRLLDAVFPLTGVGGSFERWVRGALGTLLPPIPARRCDPLDLPLSQLDADLGDGFESRLVPKNVVFRIFKDDLGLRVGQKLVRMRRGEDPPPEYAFSCFKARQLWRYLDGLERQQRLLGKKGVNHHVERGDTLWDIADFYFADGHYQHLIESDNPELVEGLLRVGEVLRILPVWRTDARGPRRLVRPGESLWSIAKSEGLDFEQLVEDHGGSDDSDLIFPLQVIETKEGAELTCREVE